METNLVLRLYLHAYTSNYKCFSLYPWKIIELSFNIFFQQNLTVVCDTFSHLKIMILVFLICIINLYILNNLNLIWMENIYIIGIVFEVHNMSTFSFVLTILLRYLIKPRIFPINTQCMRKNICLSWYESISFVLNSDEVLAPWNKNLDHLYFTLSRWLCWRQYGKLINTHFNWFYNVIMHLSYQVNKLTQ